MRIKKRNFKKTETGYELQKYTALNIEVCGATYEVADGHTMLEFIIDPIEESTLDVILPAEEMGNTDLQKASDLINYCMYDELELFLTEVEGTKPFSAILCMEGSIVYKCIVHNVQDLVW